MPRGMRDYSTYAPLLRTIFEIINVSIEETEYPLPAEVSSISIANDGPDIVYIRLNEPDAPQIKLYAGDAFSADVYVYRLFHKAETEPSKIRVLGAY